MKDSVDTMLFLEYMKACGFNIEDYSSILEILSNGTLSMSKYLRGYDTYILNSGVNYKDLRSFNLKGANGYIKDKEIYIPSTIENDKYFNRKNKYYYEHPLIEGFDAIIGCGLSNEVFDLPKKPLFIGTCIDTRDENKERIFNLYRDLAISMGYEYYQDNASILNKEMCLVRHKR